MKAPEITLYGYGYVGRAVAAFLERHYTLQIFDPAVRDPLVVNDRLALRATPFAVICVPTPSRSDGSCDTSIVEEIVDRSTHDCYLIKSTVVPGTTARLVAQTQKQIAFSPEYLGEGRYEIPFWKDMPHPTEMRLHSFHIFGGLRSTTQRWVELWQRVAGWGPTYAQTDSTTAELVKYMENAFLATKKIFCDEFYDVAQRIGVDYAELKELWLLDGRIGRSMTLIYPDSRGFGGKCLPKDVSALVRWAASEGHESELLTAVLEANERLRARTGRTPAPPDAILVDALRETGCGAEALPTA